MGRWTASQLVQDVEDRVASGELKAGERLPAVRVLAEELGIAPNTVSAAYRRLRERGVVFGRGRQGTTVAVRTTLTLAPQRPLRTDLVDAASGNPDLDLLPVVSTENLLAASTPTSRYGDAMVVPELLEAGLTWLEQDGLICHRLAVTSGAMDAVERILSARFSIGDRVGVEDPGHGPVHQIVAALGLVAVPIQIDERGVVPADLERALWSGIGAVVLTPRAQNPTGAAFDARRASELVRTLGEFPRVMVIEDDHAGPVAGTDAHYMDHQRQHWAVIRSVAKTLGPDYRLAFVAGDDETLDRVEGRMQLGVGWVSHFLQRIVAGLLSDPNADQMIKLAVASYALRRKRLVEGLATHGIPASAPSGFQVWIPVSDEESVVAAAQDSGFAIRSAASYRLGSGRAVRVTVSALSDAQIDELVEVLAEALGHSGRSGATSSQTI